MRAASFFTSSTDLTTLTPPALPRPPAWICAFTTQTGPPSSVAALTASSTLKAGMPRGVGTPYSRRTALPWYSGIFIPSPPNSNARGLFSGRLFSKFWCDLDAGVDQRLHSRRRLVERVLLGTGEFDLDHALDTLFADDHRDTDIHVLHAVFAFEEGGARQDAFLVLEIAFRHRNGRRGRRVESRTRLQQVDDLGAAIGG